MVRVKVSEGILEGEELLNKHSGQKYCSFKGIPFAQPPVEELRFKAPRPPKPWQGVREAKDFGPICHQFEVFTNQLCQGSEDCLYLNIYTPTIKPDKPLPVMFWIHGGGFVGGSGNDDQFGPHFLVNKGVIVVTSNYRLEVLGFLCLDSEAVPGNAGMKDQVAALRWVNKNISNFGGDPKNITIFGESAGAGSTSFHCISPMSKGLFQKAIIMSGVSNCNWALTCEPRERAIALAKRLGCYSEDSRELYEFFRHQPVELLVKAQAPILLSEIAQTRIEAFFSVVDEKKFGNSERFYFGDMYDVLSKGIHDGVEVIIGFTSDEGLINLAPTPDAYKARLEMAEHFAEFFVSKPLSLYLPVYQQLEFGRKMRKHYFNTPIKETDWEQLVKFYSMDLFVFGTLQWIKAVSAKIKKNLYVYKFSCSTERNAACQKFGIGELVKNRQVCCHSDELAYIFYELSLANKINKTSLEIIERTSKMWTDFAKCGNPTPDDSAGAKWLPYTTKNPNYMNIGNVLKPGTAPEQEEHEFWISLYKEFGQKVF